jgi:hypothetical protein
MSHFLLGAPLAVSALPGCMPTRTHATALVAAAGAAGALPTGLSRAQMAAVPVATVAAATDHNQHMTPPTAELSGIGIGALRGGLRIDGGSRPPPTTCLPRSALKEQPRDG